MFTGIIETTGRVIAFEPQGDNLRIRLASDISGELKVDQSLSHNGVCLTVEQADKEHYEVTAIAETLRRSNIGELQAGALVNLERSMMVNDRLDGHIVQGHVDQTATCTGVKDEKGSYLFSFSYDGEQAAGQGNVTVEKGSICVNGVSLTVVNSHKNGFSVAIIPYTFAHTNFSALKPGDRVNLEFDIIGKYVRRLMNL